MGAVALAALGCGGGSRPEGDILVTADRLFDGTELREPGAVLVRGDRIVAVGGELDARAERTIALGDATILPGFVDLHVHAEAGMLEGGVTTVRDLGSPLDALRPPGRSGRLRVLRAGPIVSVEGGYPEIYWGPQVALNVSGGAGARDAVRMLAERGAAVVKISLDPGAEGWPMLGVGEVRAIVAEAHARGLAVTAHAQRPAGVARALAAGVDELAHAPCGATDEMLQELAARQVEVVATLHVLRAGGGCLGVAERFVELGGWLLYGSDAGNPGIPAGIDLEELRLLRDAGLSPENVLAAATSRAGEQLGLAPLGTLAEGAPADLVGLRGDARELRDDLVPPLLVVAAGAVVVAPERSR